MAMTVRFGRITPEGLLLIGATELPAWAIACLKQNPQWRLLRPTGRALPSMYAD